MIDANDIPVMVLDDAKAFLASQQVMFDFAERALVEAKTARENALRRLNLARLAVQLAVVMAEQAKASA